MIWLIPAIATLTLGRNTYYAVACVLLCALQSFFVVTILLPEIEIVTSIGENCFREFGSAEAVIALIGVVGGGIVVALTIVVAVASLASIGLKRLFGLQRMGS
jgi:hypothetical protein